MAAVKYRSVARESFGKPVCMCVLYVIHGLSKCDDKSTEARRCNSRGRSQLRDPLELRKRGSARTRVAARETGTYSVRFAAEGSRLTAIRRAYTTGVRRVKQNNKGVTGRCLSPGCTDALTFPFAISTSVFGNSSRTSRQRGLACGGARCLRDYTLRSMLQTNSA